MVKEAGKVIRDATRRGRLPAVRPRENFEDARRRGTCPERVSDGSGGFDACGEPAVVRVESGLLCASCAEGRIERLERIVATVREAVK